MIPLPNLAGVATADLVEKIGGGNFSASYINWSRTLHLLREHAPGWLPEVVPAADGGLLHAAPVGCYLLLRFRNGDIATPPVPQAVMDTRNAAIQRDKITARDITDTHRRGICMAAAMTFGLAYELWAKLPLESGYEPTEDQSKPAGKKPPSESGSAPAILFDGLSADWQAYIVDLATLIENTFASLGPKAAQEALDNAVEQDQLDGVHIGALYSKLGSRTRSQLKAITKEAA
jgi:hypothetical protein